MTDIAIPTPEPGDSEDIVLALETAEALFAKGDMGEAIRWVRRAAETASDAGEDMRAVTLARAVADLNTLPPSPAVVEAAEEIEAVESDAGAAPPLAPSARKTPPPPPARAQGMSRPPPPPSRLPKPPTRSGTSGLRPSVKPPAPAAASTEAETKPERASRLPSAKTNGSAMPAARLSTPAPPRAKTSEPPEVKAATSAAPSRSSAVPSRSSAVPSRSSAVPSRPSAAPKAGSLRPSAAPKPPTRSVTPAPMPRQSSAPAATAVATSASVHPRAEQWERQALRVYVARDAQSGDELTVHVLRAGERAPAGAEEALLVPLRRGATLAT